MSAQSQERLHAHKLEGNIYYIVLFEIDFLPVYL